MLEGEPSTPRTRERSLRSFLGLVESRGSSAAAAQDRVRDALFELEKECGASGFANLPVLPKRGTFIPPPPCLPLRAALPPYPSVPSRGDIFCGVINRRMREQWDWAWSVLCKWWGFKPATKWQACGELEVFCSSDPLTPPNYRLSLGATRGTDACIGLCTLFLWQVALLALGYLFFFQYDNVPIPPLAGLNGSLVGLQPPPYGAINHTNLSATFERAHLPAACTEAVSDLPCWPFNESLLLALDYSAPNAMFFLSRYARAVYPNLWPAGWQYLIWDQDATAWFGASAALFTSYFVVCALFLLSGTQGNPRSDPSLLFIYSSLAVPRRAAQTMISYQWGEASGLAQALAAILPHAWIDKGQLQVGDVIHDYTVSAAVHSRMLVVICTPGYLTRRNCCAELQAAALHRGEAHQTAVLLLPDRNADSAAASAWHKRARKILERLPGFCVFDSTKELLAHLDMHALNARNGPDSEKALQWWQTYGEPIRLPVSEGKNAYTSVQPLPSPAMREQGWPTRHLLLRLACCNATRRASTSQVYAGFSYLSDDALELGMDYHLPPVCSFPVFLLLVQIASLACAVTLLVGIIHNITIFPRAIFLLLCHLTAILHILILWPFVAISEGLRASPFLSPLCYAACLAHKGASQPVQQQPAAAPKPASQPVQLQPAAAPKPAKQTLHTLVDVRQPLLSPNAAHAAVLAPPTPSATAPPAQHQLTVYLVHDPTPSAAEGCKRDQELADTALMPKDDESGVLFQPATLDTVLGNLRAFLLTSLGIGAEVCTLQQLLQRGPQPRAIYVLFLGFPRSLISWRAARPAWTTQQVITVLPPYEVTSQSAPELLDSMAVLAGDKCLVGRSQPYKGIAEAVLTAVAALVPGVLLERAA
jgi:hypothetical protein